MLFFFFFWKRSCGPFSTGSNVIIYFSIVSWQQEKTQTAQQNNHLMEGVNPASIRFSSASFFFAYCLNNIKREKIKMHQSISIVQEVWGRAHGVIAGHVLYVTVPVNTSQPTIREYDEQGEQAKENLSDVGFYLHIHTDRHAAVHSRRGVYLHTVHMYTLFTVLHPWVVTQHRQQVKSQSASKTTCCTNLFSAPASFHTPFRRFPSRCKSKQRNRLK